MAQLPELTNVTWHVYAMTAAGLGIIYLFPYLNKTIPSPLVCIVVLTGISMWLHLDVRTVGDMGKLPDSLPVFLFPMCRLISIPYQSFCLIPPALPWWGCWSR
jgi:SulP family sulfate permease